jgi:hypothetical protein
LAFADSKSLAEMSYWPIFKNQKDVDCVSDDEVQERVRPLLLAIEQAVDDWKPGIQETRGDEGADECEEVLMSCAFCIETLVAKLERASLRPGGLLP